ncbi:cell division protein FtsQ/DivIB [Falsarthrobacter nasiphocae]|uniref:Cell division protein FtsQ n=1 Tax=Falsarthrobacter nasiphocae TaxID=189863 RepID=A0AAE3YGF3_9MICC|nr:FtsQ-type POTRA domain-containing protein [Falsarthrobacter nasiphocae]MDR6891316.1 cell division protein FtsQ [Falsarthrobacter nasiphocae]
MARIPTLPTPDRPEEPRRRSAPRPEPERQPEPPAASSAEPAHATEGPEAAEPPAATVRPAGGADESDTVLLRLVSDATAGRGAGASASGSHAAGSAAAPGPPADDDGAAGENPRGASVVELPSRRRPRWALRVGLILALCLALSGLAVLLANVTPWMRVETVHVTGNRFVATKAVLSVVDEAKGQPLPQVDTDGLEARLEKIPGVDSATISGEPPHALRVRITERAPVAQIRRGSKVDLVDAKGRTITRVPAESAPKLPVIDAASATKPEVFTALTGALANIPANVLETMQEAKASSADSVELLMNSGVRVVWGNREGGAQKAAVLQALLKGTANPTPDPKTGAVPPAVTVIDVSVPERPVTR